MEDAAAKRLDDVRQLARKVAQFAGGRNDGEIFHVELFELRFQFFVAREGQILGRAEKPGEGAVNRVGGAGEIRVDGNAHVRAVRPVLPVFFVEQIGLGLEAAGSASGNSISQPSPVFCIGTSRHEAPAGAAPPAWAAMISRRRAAARPRLVRSSARRPDFAPELFAVAERETDAVADEAQEAFAGRRAS